MKLTQKQLRSIIAEVAKTSSKKPTKKKKRKLKESPQNDLVDQLMSNPELEGPVIEIISVLLEYTGTDEEQDEQTGEGMSWAIYEALAKIIQDLGDVEPDTGPPPLPH